jgi:crotonobetainyl-CoA:carnitine CoA-transferase CaiB-like acyl-CoA transferase
MDRFGLDWDTVHALNPHAIYLRIPAFGLSGPWRERGGFAQTMEQLTGMAWVTGYEDGPPIIPGGAVDPMSGTHAALAVVAALEHRARTGEGLLVEVPLAEVAAAVTGEQVIRYSIDKTLMARNGTRGVFRCAGDDAWVAIDPDVDPLAADARAEWCSTRTPDDVVSELRDAVPAAAMVPGHATLHDPQMQARRFFEPITHAHVDDQHYPSWPMRLSGGPQTYWTGAAPTLGQHNAEVLRDELGLGDDELARLEAAHVIGTTPQMGH